MPSRARFANSRGLIAWDKCHTESLACRSEASPCHLHARRKCRPVSFLQREKEGSIAMRAAQDLSRGTDTQEQRPYACTSEQVTGPSYLTGAGALNKNKTALSPSVSLFKTVLVTRVVQKQPAHACRLFFNVCPGLNGPRTRSDSAWQSMCHWSVTGPTSHRWTGPSSFCGLF